MVTGVLSNSIGRRPTIILLCIPLLSGWVTVGLSGGSITCICIGRVLQGFGIMSSVTQVYLVEIADAQRRYCIKCHFKQKLLSFETLPKVNNRTRNFYVYIRGWIGGSGALTVSAGITLVYVVGAFTTWRVACIICGAIPILVAITMPFLPETPNWLIANNKKEDAYKVNGLCIKNLMSSFVI